MHPARHSGQSADMTVRKDGHLIAEQGKDEI